MTYIGFSIATKAALRCAGLIALTGLMVSASAQTPILDIPNPHPHYGDNFGRNLMTSDDGMIFTGAGHAPVNGEGHIGIAYQINSQTGQIVHQFDTPEPQPQAGFGAFSWASNSRVAVSSFYKEDDGVTSSGKVYLFDRAGGQLVLPIPNPSPAEYDIFGYGMSALGEKFIIGSRADDTVGHNAGAVYIFNGLTGAILHTIYCPNPTTEDNFGYTVAGIGTDKIAVGAPACDTAGFETGAVYIFDANTGALLHSIVNPDPVDNGSFGFQVRARGNDVLIGAPGQQKAYLYDGDTGQMIFRLNKPEASVPGVFGSTVAAAGHDILVGDPYFEINGEQIGRAYLFSGYNGHLKQEFTNPSPNAGDRFGVAVAGLPNNRVVISADQDLVGDQLYCGRLYIYNAAPTAAEDWELFE